MAHKDYSATPLSKKLGIKDGMRVSLVGEPDEFPARLEPLPPGVKFLERATQPLDVIIHFTRFQSRLEKRFPILAKNLDYAGGLWIAYPKKSSDLETDLTFESVQRIGLDNGLVDNKSIAVDDDWSAVRFVYRLKDRPKP
ncbi:MAG TPA: DUF3052 domain-containing protein [Actinomycetota bacterium]|nr:DUF3052 domain-containing protein [Actinomycetota bacterium]